MIDLMTRVALLLPFALLLPTGGEAATTTAGSALRTVVTPTGIETVTVEAPRVATPLNSSTNPNPSATGLRWVYPSTAGPGPWITASVAVGNHGTFHWLGQDLNFRTVSLVSTTDDQSPAAPIYEDPLPNNTLAGVDVAAADHGPVAAAVYFDLLGGADEIRVYSGFSSTPLALPTTDAQEVSISEDGDRIAIGYRDASNFAATTVYDPALNVIQTVNTGSTLNFAEHDLSADGSTLLIADLTEDFVFDVATGALLFQDPSTVGNQAHVIDGDGDTWGSRRLRRRPVEADRRLVPADPHLRRSDVHQQLRLHRVRPLQGRQHLRGRRGRRRQLARPAGLLLVGRRDVDDAAVDLPARQHRRVAGHAAGGRAVGRRSHHRRRDVGRAVQRAPRGAGVRSRCRQRADRQRRHAPAPASTSTCRATASRIAVGTKSVHANVNGNGGEGYSFDLGGDGHWLDGTPSVGRNITLHVGGNPGEQVLLVAGLGLLPSPLAVGGVRGGWWLDPALAGPRPDAGSVGSRPAATSRCR